MTSRPYKPDEKQCCERCVFGMGLHADWCPTGQSVRDYHRRVHEAMLKHCSAGNSLLEPDAYYQPGPGYMANWNCFG